MGNDGAAASGGDDPGKTSFRRARGRSAWIKGAAFAAGTFLGAFLLFQIQPLIGKFILPWFGGATSVWTACLLFFQIMLLAGYAYAHALTRLRRTRTQIMVHLAVV